MIRDARAYKSELQELFHVITNNEEYYKYWTFGVYNQPIEISDSDWSEIAKVSIAGDKVVGLMRASTDRSSNFIDSLSIIAFQTKPTPSFLKDVLEFIKYLLITRGFRKICFTVIVGNPAERIYDRFIAKYNGRIVGTYEDHVRLIDGKLYGNKLYEITRDNFISALYNTGGISE